MLSYLRFILILLACCGFWLGLAAQDGSFTFVQRGHKPIVKGSINGKEAYFLLDTGADVTLLHAGDAQRYTFTTRQTGSQPYSIRGIGGYLPGAGQVVGAKLFFAHLPLDWQPKAVDLSSIIVHVRQKTSYRISGIIGTDMMRHYGFVIDYAENKVHVKKPPRRWERLLANE
jgi:hypothetical protein